MILELRRLSDKFDIVWRAGVFSSFSEKISKKNNAKYILNLLTKTINKYIIKVCGLIDKTIDFLRLKIFAV